MGKTTKEKKERKTKKAKKDKDAPKRAISAFFFYNQERREKLKKEKPNLDNKELIRAMSEEWNKLSDEEKKPYVKKAAEDKKRYVEEMKAYEEKKK
jgi:hypothetical protein